MSHDYRQPSPPLPPFEFDDAENKVFTSLAGSTRLVGTVVIIAACIPLVVSLAAIAGAVLGIVATGLVGGLQVFLFLAAFGWIGLIPTIAVAVGSLMMLSLGANLRRAGTSFRRIVDERGDDPTLLVDAVRELTHVYAWGRIQTIYTLAIAVIGLLFFVRYLRP